MPIYTPEMSRLGDGFERGFQFGEGIRKSRAASQIAAIEAELAQYENARRQQEHTMKLRDHREKYSDLATKRADERRSRYNDILADEAESMVDIPMEDRILYYNDVLVPRLRNEGFTEEEVPSVYDDKAIHSWRMRGLDNEDRFFAQKPSNKDQYTLQRDGATGEYVWMPKPGTNLEPIRTGTQYPPNTTIVASDAGPVMVTKGAGGPTAQVIPNKSTGGNVENKKTKISDTIKANIRDNDDSMRILDQVISTVANTKDWAKHTGPLQGFATSVGGGLGEALLDTIDPEGSNVRIDIGKLSSLKMKDMSGAVINKHEFPRLASWLAQTRDPKPLVIKKLKKFRDDIMADLHNMYSQYSPKAGYVEDPVLAKYGDMYKDIPQGQSTINVDNEKPWWEGKDPDSMTVEELQRFLEENQ